MASSLTGRFHREMLRRFREDRGLTQAEFARRAGVKEYSLYEWETGKSQPSVRNLQLLADALSVKISDLYQPPGSRGHLKDLRIMAGITQEELVESLNEALKSPEVTQSKVSNWERAKVQIPRKYVNSYAAILGVTEQDLDDAVRETWKGAQKTTPWTPLVDQREREFKGVAAGSAELEFIYALVSRTFIFTEIFTERTTLELPEDIDQSYKQIEWKLRYHSWQQLYLLLRDIRERALTLIEANTGSDREDIAERARSVIWTLDQHFTLAEDMLDLPREKLASPMFMFGSPPTTQ
ncbi:XRE family transcriptional regulator [Mycobacteroides abscessus subsp. bolletii]|uniref:helix-turn-helix domain-containing protein n=1 Tax=Mycobacteroides abscessus TaxID=36809 RepID=UPI0009A81293|nr:helix-turn-helix transcriptional regulator [Mycobacteroides abscessus]SKK40947.1 XRE family transcriptional regulator [Mycobacteroides abscessus subsp. bolletii]